VRLPRRNQITRHLIVIISALITKQSHFASSYASRWYETAECGAQMEVNSISSMNRKRELTNHIVGHTYYQRFLPVDVE
jgi:hypothetical protein